MKNNSRIRDCFRRIGAVRIAQVWEKLKNVTVKIFNIGWKAGLTLLGAVIIYSIVDEIVWEFRVRKDYCSSSYFISSNIRVDEMRRGDVNLYDIDKEEYVQKGLKWISSRPERDSVTVYCDQEDRRGFINVNTGEIVIPGTYRHAWHFSQGIAAVVDDSGKMGFINYDGDVVIPMQFDFDKSNEYVFKDGHCEIQDESTMLWGLIDRNGECTLPCEYDYLEYNDRMKTWMVLQDDFFGLLTSELEEIYPLMYDYIEYSDADDMVYLIKDGLKQLVAFDGTVVEPFVIEWTNPLLYESYNPDQSVGQHIQHDYLVEYGIGFGLYGVMDSRNGKVIIPALYDDVSLISQHLIQAEIGPYGSSVVFDATGRKVK